MIIVLGAFDGFHLGHQRLLKKAEILACSQGDPRNWGVVTFSPHPGNVIKNRNVPSLFTEEEREVLERYLRIPRTIKIPFTAALAAMTPDEFLARLEEVAPVSGIVVGDDFRFGAGRGGDAGLLRERAGDRGWLFEQEPPLSIGDEKVGSSAIRNHVAHGAMGITKCLLGYPFFFEGTVVRGDGRGAKLGFPTANIRYPSRKVLPRRGVYCASVFVDSKWMAGALNIGVNPTFHPDAGEVRAETHIIGYNKAIYGERIFVFVEKFLRDEERFETPGLLIARMKEDVDRAQEIFDEVMELRTGFFFDMGKILSNGSEGRKQNVF